MSDVEYGLILLKCLNCKTPTLFRLEICHEADSPTEYVANAFCASCEKSKKYGDVRVRELEPALVENQRVDGGGGR